MQKYQTHKINKTGDPATLKVINSIQFHDWQIFPIYPQLIRMRRKLFMYVCIFIENFHTFKALYSKIIRLLRLSAWKWATKTAIHRRYESQFPQKVWTPFHIGEFIQYSPVQKVQWHFVAAFPKLSGSRFPLSSNQNAFLFNRRCFKRWFMSNTDCSICKLPVNSQLVYLFVWFGSSFVEITINIAQIE